YERVVATGKPELVLISGYAGVGKTSLVPKLYEPVTRARGRIASAKFDQYKRDIPYATVAEAFRELLLDILTQGEEQIAAWRRTLAEALGMNGQLVAEVIPQVELVLG